MTADNEPDPTDDYSPPPGWGNGTLGEYLTKAERNAHAGFFRARPLFDRLESISDLYQSLAASIPTNPTGPQAMFLPRSISSYLAAVRCVLSGAVAESLCLARSNLEWAAYGEFVSVDPERFEIWLRRQEGDPTEKRFKKLFRWKEVIADIGTRTSDLASEAARLYDISIRFGAHPNELAATSNTGFLPQAGGTHLLFTYLHALSPTLLFGLGEVARIGLCSLALSRHVNPTHFDTECAAEVARIQRTLYRGGSDDPSPI